MPIAALIEKTIELPEGVNVNIANNVLTVKGPKGSLDREFKDPNVTMSLANNTVVVRSEMPRKREKALSGTWESHIKNMVKGVSDGFTYRMKLVYAHFPVKLSVKGDTFVIENFSGEKSPRLAKIIEGVKVTSKGDQVTIEGVNKEHVGQTMANIEQATIIRGFDRRVFQDGIYLVSKE